MTVTAEAAVVFTVLAAVVLVWPLLAATAAAEAGGPDSGILLADTWLRHLDKPLLIGLFPLAFPFSHAPLDPNHRLALLLTP